MKISSHLYETESLLVSFISIRIKILTKSSHFLARMRQDNTNKKPVCLTYTFHTVFNVILSRSKSLRILLGVQIVKRLLKRLANQRLMDVFLHLRQKNWIYLLSQVQKILKNIISIRNLVTATNRMIHSTATRMIHLTIQIQAVTRMIYSTIQIQTVTRMIQ